MQFPWLYQLGEICVLILACFLLYQITRRFVLHMIARLITRSRTEVDDILLKSSVFPRLALIPPAVLLYNFAYLFGGGEELVRRLAIASLTVLVILVLNALLAILEALAAPRLTKATINLKNSIQIVKIVIIVVGVVVVAAVLVGRSPVVILSGLGAMTAVLLLIFRDTILSFVAGIQISSYDIVRVGDWIEVPKFGADGDVIDINLHTVKVQNWDMTITVIPTHKLIEDTFRNWRGMQQSGGRRIKRSILIDVSSIKICDADLLERLKDVQLIRNYLTAKLREIEEDNRSRNIDSSNVINGRRITNIGTFRAYIRAYLENHPRINRNMILLIRQQPPGPHGLPVEIYVFTNDIRWQNYEDIQSDIFDHILAVASVFDLRMFQYPTGQDLVKITGSVNPQPASGTP